MGDRDGLRLLGELGLGLGLAWLDGALLVQRRVFVEVGLVGLSGSNHYLLALLNLLDLLDLLHLLHLLCLWDLLHLHLLDELALLRLVGVPRENLPVSILRRTAVIALVDADLPVNLLRPVIAIINQLLGLNAAAHFVGLAGDGDDLLVGVRDD